MAAAQKVRIVEKNEGSKIDFRQKGTRLYFGDDDLILRCDTRQREYPVHVDICVDDDGNLITGVGSYYVAQIDIPSITYVEREVESDREEVDSVAEAESEGTEGFVEESRAEMENERRVERVAQPLNMEDVTVTLWSIDGLYINN